VLVESKGQTLLIKKKHLRHRPNLLSSISQPRILVLPQCTRSYPAISFLDFQAKVIQQLSPAIIL